MPDLAMAAMDVLEQKTYHAIPHYFLSVLDLMAQIIFLGFSPRITTGNYNLLVIL